MVRLDRATLIGAIALLLLTAVYQAKGNVELIAGTERSSAVDLLNRHNEQRHFHRGENPFDVMPGSQPPWGYAFGALLTWPEWPAVRIYFAALNALALGFLMWFAYRESHGAPRPSRLLMMGGVAAFGGSCTATEVGQISIICTALLAGALVADRSDRPWLSGVLVALAMIKPTIAAPFAVVLVLTRRTAAVVAAGLYGIAASLLSWTITGASPLHMLRQLNEVAATHIGDGTIGLADTLAAIGASPAGVALTPLIIAVPAAALVLWTRASLPTAFAIAAVWGRTWTYHKSYDDVMLAFLLISLGLHAFARSRSGPAFVAFVIIGVLEWLPGRLLALPAVQIMQLMAWPAALMLLLRLESHPSPTWQWGIPRGTAARDHAAI